MKPICSVLGNAILAAAAVALASPAFGQTEAPFEVEEIVVYAQKRAQDIMDVPVAVTALTGQAIEDSAIKDVFDLQQNVPSLIVGQSQTATTSNFQIRGIGSTSNNFGVESSVGLYVDGVYRSRQSSMINDLIDVEAVEVLRGPQGTLFGKNTAAGAIQVRTVRPSTDETNAFLDVGYGDYNLGRISGAANIPLTDKLAFRGTIFSVRRDGYVDDDNFGAEVHNDRDRLGFRAQLGYEGDSWDMRIIGDYSEIDEVCCVALSRVDALFSRQSGTFPDWSPGTDFILANLFGTVFTDYPHDPTNLATADAVVPGTIVTGVGFDDYRTRYDILPLSKNEDRGLSVEFNKELNNGMTLTSVSAIRAFDTFDQIDVDFTDTPLLGRTNDAEQQSFSQEFRLAGEFGESSNYVAGVYYFEQTIDLQQSLWAPDFDPSLPFPAVPGLPLMAYVENLPPIQTIADGVNAVSAFTGGAFPTAGLPVIPGAWAEDIVTQDQSGWAAFFQTDIAFSDAFVLTLGGRYTDEKKDIDSQFTQALPASPAGPPNFGVIGIQLCSLDPTCAATLPPGLPVFDPADPAASIPYFAPFWEDGWAMYQFAPLVPRANIRETLKDDQFTGNAKLTWYANEDIMLYASYSTGFKAGGTNADRIATGFDPVFGPEKTESAEVGMKGTFGRLRLAVSLYQTDVEDFQANSFTGTGFNLQNAGEIELQGAEVEWSWQVAENIGLSGYFARNEGEFVTFTNGTCWDSYPFHTGLPDPGQPPQFNPIIMPEVCDRSGSKIGYNPENRAMVAVNFDFPMGDNDLFFRVEGTYASEQFTDGDLDPFTLQEAITLVNIRAGLNIDAWNSTLSFWGRNLTDERWYHGSFDPPAQDSGRMNSYPAQPLTWGVSFRKNWD
jgi:outer membrane receptor protein involved in Fe transport